MATFVNGSFMQGLSMRLHLIIWRATLQPHLIWRRLILHRFKGLGNSIQSLLDLFVGSHCGFSKVWPIEMVLRHGGNSWLSINLELDHDRFLCFLVWWIFQSSTRPKRFWNRFKGLRDWDPSAGSPVVLTQQTMLACPFWFYVGRRIYNSIFSCSLMRLQHMLQFVLW